jgi:hypothetical protein
VVSIKFPDHLKLAYVRRNNTPGKILYLNCQFPNQAVSQDKYFVFVGMDRRPLLLKINSDLNLFVKGRDSLNQCQFILKKADYGFLKYDSYLDCTRVLYLLTLEEIESQLIDDLQRLVSEIISPHKIEIVKMVNAAKTVSPYHKKIISSALS